MTTRTKRKVVYRDGSDMWTYIGGQRRLPIQWSAWLSHTRPDPPSIEELEADIIRQQRVLHNARVIEARIAQERVQAQLAAMPQPKPQLLLSEERNTPVSSQPTPSVQVGLSQQSPTPEPTAQANAVEEPYVPEAPPQQLSYATPKRSGLPKTGKDQDWQPQSWQPAPARKRT
ncbi:uncharacterized protein STEHIDRAFT_122959 [Stereum hirsutum FP-91666 SS1]|uniref:uncharacterized protein n=1 Tax=Stereum hirsutum (strain FP-91666) TaxID=721885 RepID=UPI0004449726|nr:uncharacterized protein STEHIDRAFT_122959 [Stereum hirsutum FP-91666 SS1]EIM85060.1 hypothetical protein STEHIDRAFT_122959 [Stereum hirsutum FP-91666 SS1]